MGNRSPSGLKGSTSVLPRRWARPRKESRPSARIVADPRFRSGRVRGASGSACVDQNRRTLRFDKCGRIACTMPYAGVARRRRRVTTATSRRERPEPRSRRKTASRAMPARCQRERRGQCATCVRPRTAESSFVSEAQAKKNHGMNFAKRRLGIGSERHSHSLRDAVRVQMSPASANE